MAGNQWKIEPAILPSTDNQKDAFEIWNDGYNLVMHGSAGTGKTFLAMNFALNEIISKNSTYKKVIILRSIVSGREIGFLPGSINEKIKVYEEPYKNICNELFSRGDVYQIFKTKNMVQFAPTSFLRGITFEDAIVILDEAQNCNYQELSTVITRLGNNCRIIVCGDIRQDDLSSDRYKEYSGLSKFMNVLDIMEEFDFVEFDENDIVRSGIVKSFIIAQNRLKY